MERMSIGDFARATGLTPKALRLYDEIGLVPPQEVDPNNGYRYYGADQVDTARLVARLRLVGMPLERIRAVAELASEARAAALMSYWRQMEADHASQRDMVARLVTEAGGRETPMIIEQNLSPDVAQRAGRGQRDSQLDAVMIGNRLFAVADGYGEHEELAADALEAVRVLDDLHGSVDAVATIDDAIARAAATAAGRAGSGCTLTALVVGDRRVAVAHVGDSRVHMVRDGRLERLTRDHTLIQSLVDAGRLTPEEARVHEDRALLNRAISEGTSPEPDISVLPTMPGDRFVLTTDGVHAVLAADVLSDLVLRPVPADEVAAAVEEAVLDAGAPDNYVVVVVDLPLRGSGDKGS